MEYNSFDIDSLQLIREKLRQFIMNIKQESTDIQNSMLKDYISMVTSDLVSGSFKLQYYIEIDGQTLDGRQQKVLEKTLYFKP